MQTKKEEIRQDIISSATHEFLKKGYQKSSLRTIAAKANTTLGNLYNYFPNKEAILDAVVTDIPEKVTWILDNHNNKSLYDDLLERYNREHRMNVRKIDRTNYHLYIDDLVKAYFPLDVLLSAPFLILLDGCEGTKYQAVRDTLITRFTNHVADHLGVGSQSALPRIIVTGFFSSLLLIAKSKKSMQEKMDELLQYVVAVSFGMPDL